jgi:hypothetical protein
MPMFKLKGHCTYWKKRGFRGQLQRHTEPHETLYEAASEDAIRSRLHEFKWSVESIEPYTTKEQEADWQRERENIRCGRCHVYHYSQFKSWSDRLTAPLYLIFAIGAAAFMKGIVMMEKEPIIESLFFLGGALLCFWLGERLANVRGEFVHLGSPPLVDKNNVSTSE